MGLLLRERIVFLGSSQIDDFVADAIISQFLLLDAHDPASMAIYDVLKLVTADVSIFNNCSGHFGINSIYNS
ncbi:hypothetical protein L2E82_06723 [Cichorium intybus]|uniref:Uncharacterized protein n=1 Tax=Cichorium intybus TaxID=13427 RepID=A0ACB9HAU0_CICIN|nr:hypothetical protein L2E82_06723 [Cichorium intybus]